MAIALKEKKKEVTKTTPAKTTPAKTPAVKKDEKKTIVTTKKTVSTPTTPNIEYTKRFTESAKKIDKNVKEGKFESSGVKYSGGKAEVKQYPKRYDYGKSGQKDRVLDSKGKVVSEAKTTTKSGEKFNPEFRKQFVRDSTDYANRASNNLNFVKVNTGNKKTLTAKDLKALKDLNKIRIAN